MPSRTWLRASSGSDSSTMSDCSATCCSGMPSTLPRTPWKIVTRSDSAPT